MRAMVLDSPGLPLSGVESSRTRRVRAGAPARAGLRGLPHRPARVDGELADPKLPLVPGHEIVGVVEALGEGVDGRAGRPGRRAVAGLDMRHCRYCRSGQENLCAGRASPATRSTAAMPSTPSPTPATAFRSRLATAIAGGAAAVRRPDRVPLPAHGRPTAERLGLYGFGAAAHIVAQVARCEGRQVFAFTRPATTGRRRSRATGCRVGGRIRRAAARGAGRGDHLCARRAAGAAGAAGGRARRRRSCAAAST